MSDGAWRVVLGEYPSHDPGRYTNNYAEASALPADEDGGKATVVLSLTEGHSSACRHLTAEQALELSSALANASAAAVNLQRVKEVV